jgi:predicted hydrocarbon binding protein
MALHHGRDTKAPVCAYTAGVPVGFVNAIAGRYDVVCTERAYQAQGAEAYLFELLPAEAADDVQSVEVPPMIRVWDV